MNDNNPISNYVKKCMMNNDKNIIIDRRIIENIDSLEELENIKEQTKLPDDIEFNKMFINSCDFFNSTITLSNWYDNFTNNDSCGLLLRIKTNDNCMNYSCYKIIIEHISINFISVSDFYIIADEYFNNSTSKYGNMNDALIVKDKLIGDCNCVIPQYINKYHWTIAKKYMNFSLGSIITKNAIAFTKYDINLLFKILTAMNTFCFDPEYHNDSWIRCYITHFRTCAQICFDNKYNRGIKNHIKNILNNRSKYCEDYCNIIGQILSTGYIVDDNDIKLIIKLFVDIVIKSNVIKSQKYIKKILLEKNMPTDLNNEKIFLIIEDACSQSLLDLFCFYNMNKIMNIFYKYIGSYSLLIKILEENYGYLPDEIVKILLNLIKNDRKNPDYISFQIFFETLGISYNKNEIITYIISNIQNVE